MVKSHIIPKALTRNEVKGDFFIKERNINGRIVYSRAFDSWFDFTIITQKGEDILAKLDHFAIEELREKGMVWSGSFKNFTDNLTTDIVNFYKPETMRIYFLSLIWRASVSSHPVFLSLGEIHNYSAGFDIIEGIKFFRLYHDGLIIKFMDKEKTNIIQLEGKTISNNSSLFVDNNKNTYFIKIQFKGSKQERKLLEVRKRYEL